MTLAEKIYLLRRSMNMSQEMLAERLCVSRQSVSKWESGNVTPDLDKLLMLSEVFSVSIDTLARDDTEIIGLSPDIANPDENDLDSFDDLSDTFRFEPIREETAAEEAAPKQHKRKLALSKKAIISIALCFCILVCAVIPAFNGGYKKFFMHITGRDISYPFVFVHGMGGWGDSAKINESLPYWGADSGSLSKFLRTQGYDVCEATVGPFSSCWDRACELYAQLTGSTVDYGEAHSAAHNHDRFGRKYETPIIENWGEKNDVGKIVKINLIGHSFGGNTVRLLTHLLEYGAPEEISKSEDVSPLFQGGKGDWVNSVTTLCSPHNGSTLYYIADGLNLKDSALKLFFSAAGLTQDTDIGKIYDFQLDHFGLKDKDFASLDFSAVSEIIKNSVDNAFYDLSPEGAQKLNERIETVKNVYYFSYAYSTTEKSSISGYQVPISSTLTVLKATATLMGRYERNTRTDYKIDESWLENDGLVNVISAKYPFDEEYTQFDENHIEKGIWNCMPVRTGDHGAVIGMNVSADITRNFYIELIEMINALKR